MSLFVWRQWVVSYIDNDRFYFLKGSDYVLLGFYDSPWYPGETKLADCTQHYLGGDYVAPDRLVDTSYHPLAHTHDETPHERCTCGIYGYKRDVVPSEVWNSGYHLGIAEIWGKIIVAEQGYRAQYGRIRAFVDAPANIAQDYGVPNLPTVEYARKEFFA